MPDHTKDRRIRRRGRDCRRGEMVQPATALPAETVAPAAGQEVGACRKDGQPGGMMGPAVGGVQDRKSDGKGGQNLELLPISPGASSAPLLPRAM